MLRKAMSFAAFTCLLATGPVYAETLLVEGIEVTENSTQYPGRGLSKASVEASWGAPQARSGAVGDPPITNWDYGTFVVFFEYDRVLHTVTKR